MGWGLPLEWLVGLVGTGVPLMILLTHLTGGSALEELTPERLEELVDKELASGRIDALLIADDAHSALLLLTDGTAALAWVMESHIAIRALSEHTIEEQGEALLLRQPDSGFPKRLIPVAAPEARAAWVTRLGGARGAA